MNNRTCPRINFEFTARFFFPIYLLVFIVGMVANVWGLKTLLQKWKKLGNVNIFVLNLGLADMLHLLTLPFPMVYQVMQRKWIFGGVFCKITRFCFNLNLYGSIGFLTCISVYRYLAIVHPMRVLGRITVTHSVAISAMVWLLVSVQSLPDIIYYKANMTDKCRETPDEIIFQDYLIYSFGWTITGFFIPFLITLGCYGHVIVVLCSTNTTDEVLKQKCLRLLYTLILLFSVCYIPYHLFKNLNLLARISQTDSGWCTAIHIAQQISAGLVCLNSALNPLVYLHVNEDIPGHLRQVLQQVHEMFNYSFLSKSISAPVAQTEV